MYKNGGKKRFFTTMRMRNQKQLHVQGEAGHPSYQGGGPKKNNQ
jgi:hypothetical protein